MYKKNKSSGIDLKLCYDRQQQEKTEKNRPEINPTFHICFVSKKKGLKNI